MHETERDKAYKVSGKLCFVLHSATSGLCMHIEMLKKL